MRVAVLAYGVVAYLMFAATLTYAMGFVSNVGVPKTIDVGGPVTATGPAILINAGLLLVFAVQHTIMARAGFKRRLTRMIPPAAERSTFVLAASVALAVMMWQWRPMGEDVWRTNAAWLRTLLMGLAVLGYGIAIYSTFLIDHFDLFGLRQVWLYFRGERYWQRPFVERSLYKRVRHPLMLGFLIAFWATPQMTMGHLVFAILVTAYVFVGIWFEERDLLRNLGPAYAEYRSRTPMIVPRLAAGERLIVERPSEEMAGAAPGSR